MSQQTLAPDFRLLFESVPGCYLVLLPDYTIVAASDGYLRVTMTRREAIVGRSLFEVFPDNPDDVGATGVANLRASLDRVRMRRENDAMEVQKYDIRRPEEQGGGFEERHWSPMNCPVLGADGALAYIIHRVEDVTDLVRLKQLGRESSRALRDLNQRTEERFAQLLDSAPDAMVIVGSDGLIDLVNIQTEHLFGYARDELVGQSLSLLVPERFRPNHAVFVARFFANPAARSMGSGIELFGRRKDGSELPIEVSLSPVPSEQGLTVSAAIRDITERKALEAATKLVATRLASAVDAIQDAFALFDAADKLVLCNSVYRRLFGESLSGPLVGRPYVELLDAWIGAIDFASSEERELFRNERLARRQREQTTSFDVRMADGRRLRVSDRRTPEGGIVKTIWDLTDDLRLAEELRQARAVAEAASRAKSEFLSSMSHELRTPLNAVLGFAQLLQRDKKEPLSERHKGRVAQIIKGGDHLLRLIDDILDLSRIEAGGVSISTEPIHLTDVLDEVRTTLEPMAARYGVGIEVAPLPASLPPLSADRTRYVQILINFGSNAIKYNRPAGKLTFVVAPRDGELRLTVRDTGMGIPLEKQWALFQPFQRAGQETGPIEGTGIGLAITKRLAELMHGAVGFRSVPGEGSEFWVDMPVHLAAVGADVPRVSVENGGTRLGNNGQRLVLYVEDNPANVTFMRDLLSTFDDIDLLTAPTAEAGVELARAHQPAVVIMDINLPGMSGLDALRLLRVGVATQSIPIIALTAAASERDRQRGVDAGFFRYLTKPVKVDELIGALEALLAPAPP